MKLINADKAKKYFNDCANSYLPCEDVYEEGKVDTYSSAAEYMEECEAVDAVPVIHAYWECKDKGYDEYFECSNCKEDYYFEMCNTKLNNINYCPHCGAKMDKVI